jgi:tetratricopeptide (TPR) repeat protein
VALARCYIRWAGDVEQEANRLSEARTHLEWVLKREGQHPEANYWMGHLYWKEGNKEEAYQSFAKAITHPHHGWEWVESVKLTIGNSLADAEPLFRITLAPNGAKFSGKHGPALYMRITYYNVPELLESDLKKNKPQVIADAEELARVAEVLVYKIRGLTVAIDAHGQAIKYRQDLDSAHRADAIDDIRELLKVDPDAPDRWVLAETLARALEFFASDERQNPTNRKAWLDEGIQNLTEWIPKAPAPQRQRLRKYQSDLQQKRGQMK